MSRRSARAVGRSAGPERTVTALLATLALLAGAATLLVGTGVFGAPRASRPLIDPIAENWVLTHRPLALAAAIAAGVLLAVLGLWWAVRALRPERRPDVLLDPSPVTGVTITSGALADAVAADAATVPGVERVRARLVGDPDDPALRLRMWLREGSDLRAVWQELDQGVLDRARRALEVSRLPTAIRIELSSEGRQRVR